MDVQIMLEKAGREFEFEYRIGDYIFDLVLFDSREIVEFDGPYHRKPAQRASDKRKTKVAEANGFRVIRVQTNPGVPVSLDAAFIAGSVTA